MFWVNLALKLNILFSQSMVMVSFSGYSSLGWHSLALLMYRTSIQVLLSLTVSMMKLGVIFIGLLLYVTWPFSFATLNILSLFSILGSLIIIFWSHLFGVWCASCPSSEWESFIQ